MSTPSCWIRYILDFSPGDTLKDVRVESVHVWRAARFFGGQYKNQPRTGGLSDRPVSFKHRGMQYTSQRYQVLLDILNSGKEAF